jgi:hypothetical protein
MCLFVKKKRERGSLKKINNHIHHFWNEDKGKFLNRKEKREIE